MLVDLDLPAAVDLDADVFQAQLVGVAGTTVTPEQGIGLDLLARLEMQNHPVIHTFDALVLFVVADQYVAVTQVIAERIGNFRIQEAQQLVTIVDQVDQHAETAEDRRIFATDDPGPIDDQPARRMTEGENGIAVIHPRMMEVDVCRTIGTRAGSNDDLLGHQLFHHAIGADHFDGLLIGEAARAEEQIDAIARVVTRARGHLLGDHPLGAFQHIGEGKPARLADLTKHRVGVELHDLPHRMAQRLGRDSAQVGAVATDLATAIDHRHLAPRLGGVHCRTLTRRARTQHHYVVVVDRHVYSFRSNRSAYAALSAGPALHQGSLAIDT
ncbi:hypothetical protein D3C84_362190 [compost metagenome]